MKLLNLQPTGEHSFRLLPLYPFICPHCGLGQEAPPSDSMVLWGINTTGTNCNECREYLFLSIVDCNTRMQAFTSHDDRAAVLGDD